MVGRQASTGGAETAADPAVGPGRAARNRQRRREAFLASGLHIVTEEGIEALTMARLADDLDTAIGSVYRYFGSKSDLIAAIEADAFGRLRRSYDANVAAVAGELTAQLDDSAELVRLVVLGRWFCAAAARHPDEVRLLQLLATRRSPTLTAANAAELLPLAMAIVAEISQTIEAAQGAGELDGGEALIRAVMWLTAFGGASIADDFEPYLPDLLGGGRLVRQFNTDILVGWGGSREAIERIDRALDDRDPWWHEP